MPVNDIQTEVPESNLRIGPVMPKGTALSGKDSFGQRLIALRRAHGLTQIQLAKAARITQRAISYYETDGGSPPAPVVVRLARALKVSTDELLGTKPLPRDAFKVEELHSDPESRRLWKRFKQIASLPERDQRAVIRLINSLAASRGNGLSSPARP